MENSPSSSHRSSGFLSSRVHSTVNRDLHNLVDRALDEFTSSKDCRTPRVTAGSFPKGTTSSPLEEVKNILATVRKQYDETHAEAEKKQRELNQLRERIQAADNVSQVDTDDIFRMEGARKKLEDQLHEVQGKIEEARMNKKVYDHMLARIKKEYLHIREQMLKVEKLLKRKKAEYKGKSEKARRWSEQRQAASREYETALAELEQERTAREGALEDMMDSIKRRADFERWRHEVAVEAANEAFNASAGRLRKLWVMEKLTGNCLQKIMVEQVQKSQATEDGFQRIREVTGLNDVMDIVHRFLNRELEQDHLRQCVKDAEAKLQGLKDENARLRAEAADANLFVPNSPGEELPDPLTNEDRSLYIELDERERQLAKVTNSFNISRDRLQKSRIDVEHVRRWAERVNNSMGAFEDPVDLSSPQCYQTLAQYFERLPRTIELFCAHVKEQLETGNVPIRSATQARSIAIREQNDLLNDEEFSRANCRVRSGAPPQEPPVIQGRANTTAVRKGEIIDDQDDDEDDDIDDPRFTSDRAILKATSSTRVHEAEKHLKKFLSDACKDELTLQWLHISEQSLVSIAASVLPEEFDTSSRAPDIDWVRVKVQQIVRTLVQVILRVAYERLGPAEEELVRMKRKAANTEKRLLMAVGDHIREIQALKDELQAARPSAVPGKPRLSLNGSRTVPSLVEDSAGVKTMVKPADGTGHVPSFYQPLKYIDAETEQVLEQIIQDHNYEDTRIHAELTRELQSVRMNKMRVEEEVQILRAQLMASQEDIEALRVELETGQRYTVPDSLMAGGGNKDGGRSGGMLELSHQQDKAPAGDEASQCEPSIACSCARSKLAMIQQLPPRGKAAVPADLRGGLRGVSEDAGDAGRPYPVSDAANEGSMQRSIAAPQPRPNLSPSEAASASVVGQLGRDGQPASKQPSIDSPAPELKIKPSCDQPRSSVEEENAREEKGPGTMTVSSENEMVGHDANKTAGSATSALGAEKASRPARSEPSFPRTVQEDRSVDLGQPLQAEQISSNAGTQERPSQEVVGEAAPSEDTYVPSTHLHAECENATRAELEGPYSNATKKQVPSPEDSAIGGHGEVVKLKKRVSALEKQISSEKEENHKLHGAMAELRMRFEDFKLRAAQALSSDGGADALEEIAQASGLEDILLISVGGAENMKSSMKVFERLYLDFYRRLERMRILRERYNEELQRRLERLRYPLDWTTQDSVEHLVVRSYNSMSCQRSMADRDEDDP
ncbi:hypothetical protein FOZ61_005131 [Perkinsus olseni]|uniref:Uncharacterized protein n=1 Tax=Perkinsus olseni TaxID=32597 RepID=A0A7J6LI34_PEROL|nr:hypothetical protein FOZ61_005131 [Perkinsus olseni]